MNELGIAIVWLALQVSLLCLVAAVLYAIVRNGGPRTRGVLTQSALWLVVPLSVVAFCPWPSWLDQAADVEVAAVFADSNTTTADSGSDSATTSDGSLANRAGGIGLLAKAESLVRAIGDEIRANQVAAVQATTLGWAGWLAIGFLSALAIGLLRMFVGIVAVNRYGRRASPVADKSLQETLDVLMAEFSCDRAIQLRESSEIVSAATVGWRRPVILLPSSWRTWSLEEQRSVLAHEIAHVVHNDFFNWLCAQSAVLLHFYHPLMHWLAGRLRLEQELAADAAAARHSGGAKEYLKNLAGLAVRQRDQPLAWPARAFLPLKGTLVRRIEMLRDSKSSLLAPSRWGRGSFILSVVAAAIVLSGMRQPTQQVVAQDKKPLSRLPVDQPIDGKVTAVNLRYVPADTVLFVSFRPAALAQTAGIEKVVAMGQVTMDESKLGLKIGELDQVTLLGFPVEGARNPMGDEPVGVMHANKATDFAAFIANAAEFTKEASHNGAKYLVNDGLRSSAYYRPDDRTLIAGREASIKKLIDSTKGGAQKPSWTKDLGDAATSHLVYVIDMTVLRPQILKDLQRGPAAAMLGAFSPLWEETNTVVGSVSAGTNSRLSVTGLCQTEAGTAKVKAVVDSLIPLGKNFLEQSRGVLDRDPNAQPEIQKALELGQQALESIKVGSTGKSVNVSVEVGDNGVAMLLPAIQQAREAARRAQAMNNMKQLMLAMHNYHDTFKEFPSPVMTGPDGKTKYSWRIALLPFIDHQELYKQYNQNEPWDSENNKKVLAKIPPVFRSPNAPGDSIFSDYYALVGESTAIGSGEKGVQIRDIRDGTSNTIMFVEVKRDIPWTKPADIEYDAKGELPELKGFHQGGFHVGICDGTVKFISDAIDKAMLRALITRSGGEIIPQF